MTLLRESNAGGRRPTSSTDTTTTTSGKKDVKDSSSRAEPPLGTSKKNTTTMSAAEKVRCFRNKNVSFFPLSAFLKIFPYFVLCVSGNVSDPSINLCA